MLFEISIELLTDGGEILLLHNADLEESFNYFQLSLHSSVSPIASLNRGKKKEKKKAFKLVQKAPAEKQREKLVLKGSLRTLKIKSFPKP